MPPEISKPLNSTIHQPLYTVTTFTITCEAYGTNVELTLQKDNVDAVGFSADPYTVYEPGKYEQPTGFGLNMTWQMNAGDATCDTVTRYDSENYQCVATNQDPDGNSRENRSSSISVRTRCN